MNYRTLAWIIVFATLTANTSAQVNQADDAAVLRQMSSAFSNIAGRSAGAVVALRVEMEGAPVERESRASSPFGDDFLERFFGQPPEQRPRMRMAQGCGFIISSEGYILTNAHVVERARQILVRIGDEQPIEAEVIGSDSESDVAVLKIPGRDDLPIIPLGDSDAINVGEWVMAIGNPFGLSHTVTVGIISAKGRSGVGITTYEDFIQTDAAINPGNSGGPVVNMNGEAIGMATAIVGSTGNIGIGLAIPINMAKQVYDQLIATGTVVRGYLGVTIQDLTPDLIRSFDLPATARGVLVAEVVQQAPAAKAGLQRGDVVIEINEEPVIRANDLQYRIGMLKPGTEVELNIMRNGRRQNLLVTLAERPRPTTGRPSRAAEELGIRVQNLSEELAQRLEYQGMRGVVVTQVQPESLAALAGITPGMLIQEIGRKPVTNTEEFETAITEAIERGRILLLVYNGSYSRFIVITLPGR